MNLTVACVRVSGNVPYGVEYVAKLRGMVARHLSRPFEFVCLTDQPEQVPDGVIPVRIKLPTGVFGWWAKVELFNSAHPWRERVLYLDLDTLVVASLDPIVDFPASFALVPHAGTFNGRHGLSVVKRFNSSVMVWDAGTQDHLYHLWSRAIARSLWGDQDWIGLQCPQASVMPAEWFPRLSEFEWPDYPEQAKVVLCKKPKNTDAAKTLTGFAEAWG